MEKANPLSREARKTCGFQTAWSNKGGGYPAKPEVVAYYADPRNFLDEVGVFQFLVLKGYDENSQTVDGVAFLLESSALKSYAETFIQAAKESDNNAYFLASKALQESGGGKSTLARGAVVGYEDYYNVYNIGAFEKSSDRAAGMSQRESINKNGALFAKDEGWDSLEKAIIGGANWISNKYIDVGQDNMYLNKFDLISEDNPYSNQYVQNIAASAQESKRNYDVYKHTNRLEENLVFRIPVINGMPESPTPLPRK